MRRKHFAELLAREEIGQLHHQSPGLFDGGKKCARFCGFHRYARHFCVLLSPFCLILDATPTSPVFFFFRKSLILRLNGRRPQCGHIISKPTNEAHIPRALSATGESVLL